MKAEFIEKVLFRKTMAEEAVKVAAITPPPLTMSSGRLLF